MYICTISKNGFVELDGSPSMATAEYGGDQLRLTERLQHRREYECDNPTSQTLETLIESNEKLQPH